MGSPYDRVAYRPVPLWPGITWGHDARCSCSWAYRGGVMQVKVRSSACTVHVTERDPDAPEEAEVPLPELLGQLIALIAGAAGEAGWLGGCGTHKGYNRHADGKTPACPACLGAEREYSRERKRAQKLARARNEELWQAWEGAA